MCVCMCIDTIIIYTMKNELIEMVNDVHSEDFPSRDRGWLEFDEIWCSELAEQSSMAFFLSHFPCIDIIESLESSSLTG